MTQWQKRQDLGEQGLSSGERVDIKRAGYAPPTDLQNWMRKVYRRVRLQQAEGRRKTEMETE